MTTLAFDGRMGASGDMLLGALLAAGADRDVLAPVEERLDVHYEVSEVDRHGIAATSVTVRSVVENGDNGTEQGDDGHAHARADDHDHSHTNGNHDHEHEGDHPHDHGAGDPQDHGAGDPQDHGAGDHQDHEADDHHAHDSLEGSGPARTYEEVLDIVDEMALPASVRGDAAAIFEILAEAEAAVHGTDVEGVHFHEVGADDAIADVVGVCLLVDDLAADRVETTPLSGGGGEVAMAHGTYPVPTPAVVELAERATWELRGGPVDEELLTPTGAAILAHVAEGVEALPALRVDGSGYGAGTRPVAERPNVLRAVVGTGADLHSEPISVLETNVDDVTPEVLGGLQETLADAGALDVSIVPLTMKKARPGHLVKVVCRPEDADVVARRLAEETGTLGVREHGAGHRWVADRETEAVHIDVAGETFAVGLKVARDGEGTVFDLSAEYEDALAVARSTDLPVREVARRAEAAWRT